jgi:uncharacterized coiled-coil DUF342 family protein
LAALRAAARTGGVEDVLDALLLRTLEAEQRVSEWARDREDLVNRTRDAEQRADEQWHLSAELLGRLAEPRTWITVTCDLCGTQKDER